MGRQRLVCSFHGVEGVLFHCFMFLSLTLYFIALVFLWLNSSTFKWIVDNRAVQVFSFFPNGKELLEESIFSDLANLLILENISTPLKADASYYWFCRQRCKFAHTELKCGLILVLFPPLPPRKSKVSLCILSCTLLETLVLGELLEAFWLSSLLWKQSKLRSGY